MKKKTMNISVLPVYSSVCLFTCVSKSGILELNITTLREKVIKTILINVVELKCAQI